jgi:hypothetical protein
MARDGGRWGRLGGCRLIAIGVTVYRSDRTLSCGRSGNDLHQSLSDVAVEKHVLYGTPSQAVEELVARNDTDLVATGPHGRAASSATSSGASRTGPSGPPTFLWRLSTRATPDTVVL